MLHGVALTAYERTTLHDSGPAGGIMRGRFFGWSTVQVQAVIDAWLEAKLTAISTKQNEFFGTSGRYWQGLITHTAQPAYTQTADGQATADELDRTPSDQPGATWEVQQPSLTGKFPASLTVDVYHSPSGHGWTLIVQANHSGVKYFRAIDPVAVTDTGWRVTP